MSIYKSNALACHISHIGIPMRILSLYISNPYSIFYMELTLHSFTQQFVVHFLVLEVPTYYVLNSIFYFSITRYFYQHDYLNPCLFPTTDKAIQAPTYKKHDILFLFYDLFNNIEHNRQYVRIFFLFIHIKVNINCICRYIKNIIHDLSNKLIYRNFQNMLVCLTVIQMYVYKNANLDNECYR